MKIIVSGGAGFIGSHLVEILVSLNHDVTVVDNFSTGKGENLNPVAGKIKVLTLDLASSETKNAYVIASFEGEYDVFFHLAALPRIGLAQDQPVQTHMANVIGTMNAIRIAELLKVKKFIYASSSSVYGEQKKLPLTEDMTPNPVNRYAMQKYMGELECQLASQTSSMQFFLMRFFNVYGERMAFDGAYKLVFANWIEAMKKKEPLLIYGDGLQSRDFTHVYDVSTALHQAMFYKGQEKIQIYNVGSGIETSILRLAELFNHKTKKVTERPYEERNKVASIEKTIRKLGWQPKINIELGVGMLKDEYGI